MSSRLALILCLLFSLMALLQVVSARDGYLIPKSYTTLPVERGDHIATFSSNCSLVLGYIRDDHVAELVNLPNSISSNFTILASASNFFEDSIVFHYNSYLVLFNNENVNCKYYQFSSMLTYTDLDEDEHPFELQYGVFEIFKLTSGYFKDVHIISKSNSIMNLKYYSEARRECPSSVSMLNLNDFKEVNLLPKANVTIPTITSDPLNTFMYLYCMDAKGCYVRLSSNRIMYDPSSDIAVGIVVPLLCIGVCSLVSIIIIFSIRNRRMNSEFSKEHTTLTNHVGESINTEQV